MLGQSVVKALQKCLKVAGSCFKGSFYILEANSSLARITLIMNGKRWGLFPAYTVQKAVVPLRQIAFAIIGIGYRLLRKEFDKVPESVLKNANSTVRSVAQQHARAANTEMREMAAGVFGGFNENDLANFVKADRNKFRQELIVQMGKDGALIFRTIVKNHLSEFIMRVRQEMAAGESSSSGEESSALMALPTGTRFFVKKGKMTIFVIEQPPQQRTLQIMDVNGDRSDKIRLSFPYVIFFTVLRGKKSDKLYALFGKEPLRDLGDALLCPALPNIYPDFSICFSASAAKNTLAEMAEESINNFWGGRFIKSHDPSNLAHQLAIDKWSEGSQKDALFGSKYPWRDAQVTVASMLEKISSKFGSSTREVGGKNALSNLQVAVNSISQAIANQIQEKCFDLVPKWEVEETARQQLNAKLREAIEEAQQKVRGILEGSVEGLFSDGNLEQILTLAVDKTMATLKAENNPDVAAIQESFLDQFKEESSGEQITDVP